MSALVQKPIWPGCFGWPDIDWKDAAVCEAAANSLIDELRCNQRGSPMMFLRAMQFVDWHTMKQIALPLPVVMVTALALKVERHLRWLEAALLQAEGFPAEIIADRIGTPLDTYAKWRASKKYQKLVASCTDHENASAAFGRYALPDRWDAAEAINEAKGILDRCSKRGDARRGDDYPKEARERLLEIMLWFSSQQIPLPEEVWLATACALELATYKGGMRKSVAGRAHPEIYHRAVLADSDMAIADWRARKDRGEIATALSYPRLDEVSFASVNSVDKQIQFGDWKTLKRWRQTATYRLAWAVNILVERRQGDQPVPIGPKEYAVLQDLQAKSAQEHAELRGMPRAVPSARLIKRKRKPLADQEDR